MVNIAIMGHGVVGSGVVEVILSHKESILRHAHEELNIQYILDRRSFRTVHWPTGLPRTLKTL